MREARDVRNEQRKARKRVVYSSVCGSLSTTSSVRCLENDEGLPRIDAMKQKGRKDTDSDPMKRSTPLPMMNRNRQQAFRILLEHEKNSGALAALGVAWVCCGRLPSQSVPSAPATAPACPHKGLSANEI